MANTIYPSWLIVEYAITLFKSFWYTAIVPAIIAVKAPSQLIIIKPVELYSSKGDNLINKYTPAVTIVAACINADTGVGPSIADGSHTCRPNCADFAIAPINTHIVIIVTHSVFILLPRLNIDAWSKSPIIPHIVIIPIVIPQSPTLFTINACIPALFAFILLYQYPTKRYEHTPTPSQPMNIVIMLSPLINTSMKKVNSDKYV